MILRLLFVSASLLLLAGSAAAQISIYDSAEAHVFFGRTDPLSAPSAWENRLQRWADKTCQASVDAKDRLWKANQTRPHSEQLFPGESIQHRLLGYPGSHLFYLVATDLVPSRNRSNIYARVSQPYEDRLFNRIAAANAHSLEPEDLMGFALEITGGDYRLAALTAHAVLKEATKLGREAMETSDKSREEYLRVKAINPNKPSTQVAYRHYRNDFEAALKTLSQQNRIVRPLKSLRADPTRIADKMGPWYHIFALYTLDALGGGEQALAAYAAEHGGKYFRTFLKEGGYEPEKKRIDEIFIKTQVACIPEWTPKPQPPAVQPPTPRPSGEGQVSCPQTRYPLMPAHEMKPHPFADKKDEDYAPGKILRTRDALPTFRAYCRYGRVGAQVFKIDVEWNTPPEEASIRNPTPYCLSPQWNSYGTFGWNHVFASRDKHAVVQIGRRFEGGNRYSDPLSRAERDAAARYLMDQVEPLASDCIKPKR